MTNKENIDLNVPLHLQTENYTCVPSCCKMILDYLNQEKLKTLEPDFTENHIAEIMNTKISGTRFSEIENINKVLTKSEPSVEFSAEFQSHTLEDIRNELRQALPVSVWIFTGSMEYLHSIVITGIDDEKKIISYNDPIYGIQKISQSKFITRWEQGQALMIKAKIGKINRYTLDRFSKETTDEQD